MRRIRRSRALQHDGHPVGRRHSWLLAVLCVLLLWPAARLPAYAADRPNGAGLVIRHGDGHIETYYVEFTSPEITGLDLLQRAGVPLTIATYAGLGAAVCAIAQEGCPAENCFCKSYSSPAYFWHYYRLTPDGTWVLQSVGPSSRKVHDGDVDGWSWTAGASGLPAISIDAIAAQAGVQRHSPTATQSPPTPSPPPPPSHVSTPSATLTVHVTPTPEPPHPTPTPQNTAPATSAVSPQATHTPPPAVVASPSPTVLVSPSASSLTQQPAFSSAGSSSPTANQHDGPFQPSPTPLTTAQKAPAHVSHQLRTYGIYAAFTTIVLGLLSWAVWRRHHFTTQRRRE